MLVIKLEELYTSAPRRKMTIGKVFSHERYDYKIVRIKLK